jgi:acyl carrier protein
MSVLLKTALAALRPAQRQQVLEVHLCDRVAKALGVRVADVDAQRPLGSLGLDSLKAVEMQHGIERELDISMPMADVLSARNVAELAGAVLERMFDGAGSSIAPVSSADRGRLSRGQEALWVLHQLSPESAAYNIAYAMRVRSLLDLGKLKRTLQVLIDRHVSLRTRFENRNGRPWASVLEREEVSLERRARAGLSGRAEPQAVRPRTRSAPHCASADTIQQ